MNLISGTHDFYERREYAFNILPEYSIITREKPLVKGWCHWCQINSHTFKLNHTFKNFLVQIIHLVIQTIHLFMMESYSVSDNK